MVVQELLHLIGFKVNEGQLAKAHAVLERLGKKGQQIGAILSAALTAPILLLTRKLLKSMGSFEQLEVAFTTMLQSGSKAKTLMEDIFNLAEDTPFQVGDIAKGAKMLLAYGIQQRKVIDTTKWLGNVSAGLSVPIERLILNYGQVKSLTKLTGREMRDFATAGVPLLEVLAKQLNITESAVKNLISKGGVSFKMVEEAFKNMATGSGRFANLMEKQAKTLLGAWTVLQDQLTIGIVKKVRPVLEPFFKSILEKITEIAGWLMKRLSPSVIRILAILGGAGAVLGPITLFLSTILTVGGSISALLATTGISLPAVLMLGGKFVLLAGLAVTVVTALSVALGAIIEDIIVWTKGGDSIAGMLFGDFEVIQMKIIEYFSQFEFHFNRIIALVKENMGIVFRLFQNFISNDADGMIKEVEVLIENITEMVLRSHAIMVPILIAVVKILFNTFYTLAEKLFERFKNLITTHAELTGHRLIAWVKKLLPKIGAEVNAWITETFGEKGFNFFHNFMDKAGKVSSLLGKGANNGNLSPDVTSQMAGQMGNTPANSSHVVGQTGNQKSYVLKANINAYVPEGTPQAQQNALKSQAEQVYSDVFSQGADNLFSIFPEVE